MQFALSPFATTSLGPTILCWFAIFAIATEGFATTTISTTTTTTTTIAGPSPRMPPTTAVAMLSSVTSSAAASAAATPTFVAAPRRRFQNPPEPFGSARNTVLDLAVGGGGAAPARVRPSAAASARTRTTRSGTGATSLFSSASGQAPDCPFTRFAASLGAVWGSLGVVYILAKGISRALPFALDPLYESSSLVLSPIQWSLYALSCVFFAYAEGYKGFHTRFAPLVVKRSFTLVVGTPQGNNPFNFLLAPLYSMGLWGATPKRLKVSWGLNVGIVAIVAAVKRLPPAPRCIIDAGVVLGLTVGSASILYHFLVTLWTGRLPAVDACLPARKSS